MGAFVSGGEATLIWAFALIYFVVCYLSVACWAYTGAFLSRYLHSTRRIRLFNRGMAAMLVAARCPCCGFSPCTVRAWPRGVF